MSYDKTKLATGLINNYIIKPKNLTQYTALRGVTDFTQLAQFDQFETGYSQLYVLSLPKFIEELAKQDQNGTVANMINSFKHMLEFEFRGLSGLPGLTSNTFTISDGSNEQQIINDVVRDTSVELSSTYYEKRGTLINKFIEYYLTGIKDPISKAKNYHGLIAGGVLAPGIENEVGTFMYIVTDNTYLRIERAFLLTNVQFTQTDPSIYESEKGQISNKETTVNFRCFPIWGEDVDKAAKKLLEYTNGVKYTDQGKGNEAGGYNNDEINGKEGSYTEILADGNESSTKLTKTIYESPEYHWGIYTDPTKAPESIYASGSYTNSYYKQVAQGNDLFNK